MTADRVLVMEARRTRHPRPRPGVLSSDVQIYRLYYQNPKLGFFFMRLIVERLLRDVKRGAIKPGTVYADPLGARANVKMTKYQHSVV